MKNKKLKTIVTAALCAAMAVTAVAPTTASAAASSKATCESGIYVADEFYDYTYDETIHLTMCKGQTSDYKVEDMVNDKFDNGDEPYKITFATRGDVFIDSGINKTTFVYRQEKHKVTVTSSKPSIVSVKSSLVGNRVYMTAKKCGTAIITAKTSCGNKYKIKVTVKDHKYKTKTVNEDKYKYCANCGTTTEIGLSGLSELSTAEYRAKYGMTRENAHHLCTLYSDYSDDTKQFDASQARELKVKCTMQENNKKAVAYNVFGNAQIGDIVRVGNEEYRYLTSVRMTNGKNDKYDGVNYDVALLSDKSIGLRVYAVIAAYDNNKRAYREITETAGTNNALSHIVDEKYAVYDVPMYGDKYSTDATVELTIRIKDGGLSIIYLRYEDVFEYIRDVGLNNLNYSPRG